MTPPLVVIVVPSTGTRKGWAFVHYADPKRSGLQEVESPTYPPSPNGDRLRETRGTRGMGLRDCARLLGLAPSDLSGLENDWLTLSPEDWARAFEALEAKP